MWLQAWAPVALAMLEVRALQWWEARTGGELGEPHEWVRPVLEPLGAAAAYVRDELDSDTLLILLLSMALGAVLYHRQRQQLPP